MRGEWKIQTLSEAPVEIIDGDRGVNYPKQSDFKVAGHCLFLNTGNVTTSGFDFSGCSFVSEAKDAALRKGKLRRHDVVLTTRGTVGNVALFDDAIPFENVRINSGMVILRANPSEMLPRFLYLYVRSKEFKEQVASFSTGSAQPQLPIRDMVKISIPLPPLSEQRAIAQVLGTLDDKIELNRRMNETLEAMTHTLFKSWFANFDPVRATAAGQIPLGLNPAIAALFPDHFEESVFGEIPKGWLVKTINEATAVIIDYRGKTPKKLGHGWSESGIPAVSAKNIKKGRLVEKQAMNFVHPALYDLWMKDKLAVGDILMTSEAPLGELLYLSQNAEFCLSQRVLGLRANPAECFPTFLYLWLASNQAQERLQSRATGTTVLGIRQSELRKLEVLLPPMTIQERAHRFCEPCISRIASNEYQNETLAALRDALLPKLMSGQLRIPSDS